MYNDIANSYRVVYTGTAIVYLLTNFYIQQLTVLEMATAYIQR